MTVEEIFQSEWYRSIIFLTREYDKGNGLRQLHYRWALIENHDGIKQTLFVKEMKDFFKNEDPVYNEMNWIVKNCITSNTNLSNFLKRLVDEPYQLLEKFKEDELTKYRITKKGLFAVKKWMVIDAIVSYDLSEKTINELNRVVLIDLGEKMLEDLGFSGYGENPSTNGCRGFY